MNEIILSYSDAYNRGYIHIETENQISKELLQELIGAKIRLNITERRSDEDPQGKIYEAEVKTSYRLER